MTPLRTANATGLPPATIINAQIDPVRSVGEAYAAKLAGVAPVASDRAAVTVPVTVPVAGGVR